MSPTNRPVVALSAAALLSAGVLAACSGPAESESGPMSSSTTATGTAAAKPGRTGDTLTLTRADGSTIAVTLERIITPATVAPGKGDPAVTYIATQLKIANQGSATMNGNANTNVWVLGSDDHSYEPDLNNVSECANFDSGMFHISPGDSATGCVVFALPHGVSPAKVKYAPSSGFADDFGEWLAS
ncbi:DUF4352 domain-containing protein [Mycolicibacter senuensis]|uniref:DUF4352 domain-containing protein n=1 Tax=Mycolicibacter senuensis TaxID=386913 RepID=A0A7I9XGS0_9MYCO|nr:DUF4352 domain-containing protein [Mycolicibacter senuensis]GFG69162.1 hypothetical protein MSEN_08820 [Mycolicibacter senuensis]